MADKEPKISKEPVGPSNPPSAPEPKPEPKVDNDPDALTLNVSDDGEGNFSVLIRVLNAAGRGLKTVVNILYRGHMYSFGTNDEGNAVFKVPDRVKPGESFKLQVGVSGIRETASVNISRRRKIHRRKRFSSGWWKSNNGRAFIFSIATAVLWIFCLIIGPGEPVLNKMTFRNESSGLSSAEERYNRTMDKYNQARPGVTPSQSVVKKNQGKFVSQKHESRWQHGFLVLAVLMTLFVMFYVPLSFREEIAEEFREGAERIFHRSSGKADDPTHEKLGKWLGLISAARRAKTGGEPEPGDKTHLAGHPSLGTLFNISLLSDTLVEVVPALLKRIF